MRNYNIYKQQRTLACADDPGMKIYKKPLTLVNVGWYDQKNAPVAQHAVPSHIVAMQTPIFSSWLRRDF